MENASNKKVRCRAQIILERRIVMLNNSKMLEAISLILQLAANRRSRGTTEGRGSKEGSRKVSV